MASDDPIVDAIDVEITAREADGFSESFQNGSHKVERTPLIDLQTVQDRREQKARARAGGSFRLSQFDPNL